MKKITAIEVQKKNPNRVNVYLDGEFGFGAARIVAAWLKVGDTLDEARISKLQAEDVHERAYQQAMLFLSYRARSEAEIRNNLRKHDYPDAVIGSTIERLRQDRLADDKQFARAWVENRTAFRPRGRRALTMELRQKGLDDETVQTAVAGLDEEALAQDAGRKRLDRLRGLDRNDFRRKMGEFLGRRGFSYDIISLTVQRLWDETHAGQEEYLEGEDES